VAAEEGKLGGQKPCVGDDANDEKGDVVNRVDAITEEDDENSNAGAGNLVDASARENPRSTKRALCQVTGESTPGEGVPGEACTPPGPGPATPQIAGIMTPQTPQTPSLLLDEVSLTRTRSDARTLPPPPPLNESGPTPSSSAQVVAALRDENRMLREQSREAIRERDYLKNQLKERVLLQASVQAQIAARNSLQAHNDFLEARYRRLLSEQGSKKEKETIEQLQVQLLEAQQETASLQEQILGLEQGMSDLDNRNTELIEALERAEVARRMLHEEYMSSRGNMRVYCRLRPTQETEDDGDACKSRAARYAIEDGGPGGMHKKLRVDSEGGLAVDGITTKQRSWSFGFDRVFGPKEDQKSVFLEVQGLVQSVLDGYNACIFAYGQTGSGKTHTMMGCDAAGPGICPRSIQTLFQACNSRLGKTYSLALSFLEIYNETLVDLLPNAKPSPKKDDQLKPPLKRSKSGLQIRHDGPTSTTYVDGLNIVDLRDEAHTSALIEKALTQRTVAKTRANDRSSRSHCVLSLYVTPKNDKGEELSSPSVLHLVDLAGSERLNHSRSDSDPKLLKEQCAINTSLTALKNTLRALANKQGHVPFRDSKLTYLLQNAWQSSSSKTLMICTVSQQVEHLNESLNTIRFAERVLQDAV